jgi:antibiotic biosynthesis monooxygenase (ABM) superfamily enzyme
MSKDRIINIVATECIPGDEVKFNKWYNEVHIPMLMKFKGIKKVTRYKVMGESTEKGKYLAIYEYDSAKDMAALNTSPEFKAAIEEMNDTWKGRMFDLKWAMGCEPIKTFGK